MHGNDFAFDYEENNNQKEQHEQKKTRKRTPSTITDRIASYKKPKPLETMKEQIQIENDRVHAKNYGN